MQPPIVHPPACRALLRRSLRRRLGLLVVLLASACGTDPGAAPESTTDANYAPDHVRHAPLHAMPAVPTPWPLGQPPLAADAPQGVVSDVADAPRVSLGSPGASLDAVADMATPEAPSEAPPGPECPRGAAASVVRTAQPALSSAVTLLIEDDPSVPGPWPGAQVRCDGMRIAPHVVLTAAHCFAWHRIPDTDTPPLARVWVHSLGADARQPTRSVEAVYVAIHPHYPALACSQPHRSTAASCLRAASACWAVHGSDTPRRSACVQGVSAQVIEQQQHGAYDLALVFEGPAQDTEPLYEAPQATLVRDAQMHTDHTVWLSRVEAASDAWDANAPGSVHNAWPRHTPLRLSFDITADAAALLKDELAYATRRFDGAFAAPPKDGAAPYLLGWASRALYEQPRQGEAIPQRYTRLGPHLVWIVSTVASVSWAYPKLPLQMPRIVDSAPQPDAAASDESFCTTTFASPGKDAL